MRITKTRTTVVGTPWRELVFLELGLVVAGGLEELPLQRLGGSHVVDAAELEQRPARVHAKALDGDPVVRQNQTSARVEALGEVGERFDQALGSVVVGRALGERLGAFAELYGFAPASSESDDDAAYFDGGLTIGFGLDAQLDVRAGVGLTDASADWLFGLGFARRW